MGAHELTADRMGGAIQHHGCVLVRGLIPRPVVERLVADIDRAFDAAEAWRVGGEDGDGGDGACAEGLWFEPFAPDPRYTLETLDYPRFAAAVDGLTACFAALVLGEGDLLAAPP